MAHKIPIEFLENVADTYKFLKIDYQPNIEMISYSNGAVRINVYLTTGTISTSMNHPKKGKTQLFRKNLTFEQIKETFKNPRVHSGKGYYTKKK